MIPLIVAAVAGFAVTKGAVDGTLFSGGDSSPTTPTDAATAANNGEGQPKEQTVNEAVKQKQ